MQLATCNVWLATRSVQRVVAQEWYADSSPSASWLADNFGGGLVRVESTSSAVLRSLAVQGAEMTDKLPPRSIELMRSVNASGRYFEFYAARNYFDRGYDHDKTALHALPAEAAAAADDDDKCVAPARIWGVQLVGCHV